MRNTEFKPMLEAFLIDYLPDRRGCSANTVASYRDAFVLMARYAQSEGAGVDGLSFGVVDRAFVEGFLSWLADERGCEPQTCNNRLAAVKSFFRFVQMEAPERMAQASQVLAIRKRKVATGELAYLPLDAIGLILDSAGECCIRDLAMLALLYDSGARVQELADARVCDIRLEPPRTIKLTGKGNKTRIVPVTAQVGSIVSKYLRELGRSGEESLFANYKGDPIGRAGIAYTLQKHVGIAHEKHPEAVPSRCHPHTMRHSKAMHMLEAGVNLVYIRDFLGHASVTTTERYARASPEMKRKAVDTLRERFGASGLYGDRERDDLAGWLRSII